MWTILFLTAQFCIIIYGISSIPIIRVVEISSNLGVFKNILQNSLEITRSLEYVVND